MKLGYKTVMVSVALCMSITAAVAAEDPRALAKDKHIKIVSYQEDNVVNIHGTTFIITQIILSQDETVMDIQGGDADAWYVYINKSLPYILNIKPTIMNSDTDLSVVTTKPDGTIRHYYFHLTSNQKSISDQDSATYAIRFSYPDKQNRRYSVGKHLRSNNPSFGKPYKFNWEYSYHGASELLPLRVFDDGRFTYIQLHKGQKVPGIFLVDNSQGKEHLANYRKEGDYLVILELSPQITLRDGPHHVASIFNEPMIADVHHVKGSRS